MSEKYYYVNEYEVDKKYGGPEEGGWYYDTGRFIKCHGIFDFDIGAALLTAGKEVYLQDKRKGLHPPDSVLSEGRWPVMYIERSEGRDFPKQVPHYE